jgi:protein phosphatase
MPPWRDGYQGGGEMLKAASGCRTDVGRKRTLNEDSVVSGRQLWAVADGMGGHAAGDVASRLVAETLRELDAREALRPGDVVACLGEANQRILDYAAHVPAAAGLGSTVAGIAQVVVGGADHWAVFNVGDSRVYRCQAGTMARATIDHSETEELILEGRISEDEARHHKLRNVITRSLGTDPSPRVDLWVLPQTPGDRFLVCSDGLTNELTDPEIARVLLPDPDPDHAAGVLLAGALAAGARDNVSVIVVDLAEPSGPAGDLDDDITKPRQRLTREGHR